MPTKPLLSFLCCASLFAACGGPPAPAPLACTLVLLKTGAAKPSQEESAKVFAGHFANMQRLAREGHLLVAGPYGKEKSDPALRGLFVLATGDRAQAKAWAETDPGFQAGVFALEYRDFTTGAPLRENLTAELAAEDAAKAAGKEQKPGDRIRPYVVANVSGGVAAQQALAGQPGVLLLAALDGDHTWALLDAKDLPAAQALLQPAQAALGTVMLDSWFSSSGLAELPRRATR